MANILFVGIKPSSSSPDESAFHPDTRSGKTVREWIAHIGITENNVSFCNLKDLKMIQDYLKVVACGNFVSRELTKMDIPHFRMGHPSGLNRQWNDKVYKDLKLQQLKEYICETQYTS